ncbi:hypothetical protein D3C85_1861470 [compost metagenome]
MMHKGILGNDKRNPEHPQADHEVIILKIPNLIAFIEESGSFQNLPCEHKTEAGQPVGRSPSAPMAPVVR